MRVFKWDNTNTPEPIADIDFLKDCIRDAWTTRAGIGARGFDSDRRRKELADEVDEYLEELFIHVTLADMDAL